MRLIIIALAALVAAAAAAAVYLRTPVRAFDAAAARAAAAAYDARIIRDRFGVPHIYGARDADVAFGLGYAHAEDDFATIAQSLAFARGELGRLSGKDGAVTDYLVNALRVRTDLDARYETDLSAGLRAALDGYAAGLNLYCAEARARCPAGSAPVSGKEIAAGFVARTPFFYSLDEELKALFEGAPKTQAALERVRTAFLKVTPGAEIGSNAIAVAPSRATDGHTRLMINSHQPYIGPVAWYEVRVKSEEGWDMIGGVFPGSPLILHGAGPNLGWAHTVNLPDLVDIYALEVDDVKKPTRYRLDGEWRPLERGEAKFRVKLFGPFSLPVTRPTYRSVHGPAFVTPSGVFAVAYGGQGEVRAAEQWYRMNKATDFESWRAAMAIQGLPSFNAIYADRTGKIAYFYNAAIPVRAEAQDWSKTADGGKSDLVWSGVRPFGSAPSVIAPASGYVVNANNHPFDSSGEGDNPDPAGYPPHYGIDARTTNRGYRLQELYGADAAISEEEFLAYKFDDIFSERSRVALLIGRLLADEDVRGDPELGEAVALLEGWDRSTNRDSRAAALATRTARLALGWYLAGEYIVVADEKEALKQAAGELKAAFGRIDPLWSEVMRLKRGEASYAIDGAPEVLRAVYPDGEDVKGAWTAAGGDTLVIYADWAAEGPPKIRTIHQFGSATLDASSPHYGDQAPLFASEQWRSPPMSLQAVAAEATRDYRPGR